MADAGVAATNNVGAPALRHGQRFRHKAPTDQPVTQISMQLYGQQWQINCVSCQTIQRLPVRLDDFLGFRSYNGRQTSVTL